MTSDNERSLCYILSNKSLEIEHSFITCLSKQGAVCKYNHNANLHFHSPHFHQSVNFLWSVHTVMPILSVCTQSLPELCYLTTFLYSILYQLPNPEFQAVQGEFNGAEVDHIAMLHLFYPLGAGHGRRSSACCVGDVMKPNAPIIRLCHSCLGSQQSQTPRLLLPASLFEEVGCRPRVGLDFGCELNAK